MISPHDQQHQTFETDPPLNADAKREILCAVLEGVVGQIPITGSVLAKVYEKNYPPQSLKDWEKWEVQISDRSNEHDHRIEHVEQFVPRSRSLPQTTAKLCVELANRSTDGLRCEDRTSFMVPGSL